MIVECHVKTVTNVQSEKQGLDDYAMLFQVWFNTEKAHKGQPQYHPVLHKRHLAKLWDSAAVREMAEDKLLIYTKETEAAAMESSCKEFNSGLFMLMADDTRYKALKFHLHNASVTGNEIYRKKLTLAKRMLADFKALADKSTVSHQLALTGDSDKGAAFVEAECLRP